MATNGLNKDLIVTVVIPAYKVSDQIIETIESIGSEVQHIIVVDDACTEGSGNLVVESGKDSRVEVIFHEENLGVGGAMKTGYVRALELGSHVIVKIDGDGQMDSTKISEFTRCILEDYGDYIKGNRFFDI